MENQEMAIVENATYIVDEEQDIEQDAEQETVPVDEGSSAVDGLDVDFALTFPSVSLSLREFREIESGMTVKLGLDLNSALEVWVGGTKQGTGVLVQVGEKIGLQVVEWDSARE